MGKEESFWAADVVKRMVATKRDEYVCEGMWTPSGYFHIGNARSELFTPYSIYLELIKEGYKAKQNFIIDDFDPVEKIPKGVPIKEEDEKKYVGFSTVFAPDPFGEEKSWGDYFKKQVTNTFEKMGLTHLNIQSSYENYKSGRMNEQIIFSLDHAKEIVKTWNEITGAEKPADFLPVTVVCENCKKIMYTKATAWDGKEVTYKCAECKHEGKISPLNANAKLNWRVHWVVNWIVNDVAFESGGKDHFSKGGSVDLGRALMKNVFKKEPPIQTPTEFIQVGGAKMGGSVGNVVDLKEWLRIANPESFRYLFLSNRPNHAIEFTIEGNPFILLNDRLERAEKIYYGKEKAENESIETKMKRAYEMSVIGEPPKEMPLRVPYSYAAQLAGMMDPKENFSQILESLVKTKHVPKEISKEEEEKLQIEFTKARAWVETYSPDKLINFAEKIDTSAFSEYKELFSKSISIIEKEESPDEIQQGIYEVAKELELQMKDAFKAFYQVLIGKERGPRLGMLIIALGKEKVLARLNELK